MAQLSGGPGFTQARAILCQTRSERREMRSSVSVGSSRRGITVLGLVLLIIAIVVAAALFVRYY
jgi:hypothetical protein